MAFDKIEIKKLRIAFDRIFDHIESDLKIQSVAIGDSQNFYWSFDSDNEAISSANPPAPGVGSLWDDYEFISKLVAADYVPPSLMLIHLAPLLRHVGQEIGQ
jgi:hypothetical protein